MLVRLSAGAEGVSLCQWAREGQGQFHSKKEHNHFTHFVTWGLTRSQSPPQYHVTDNPFFRGFLGGFQSGWVS